jgi:hypothetical protein
MSRVRTVVSVFLFLVLAVSIVAQQTATSPQAVPLLRRSVAALVGNQSISDVTITATARRIAGSDDEAGTATLKATSAGASRLDLALPSGPRTEILNLSSDQPSGSWSGPDGMAHPIAYHNLLTGAAPLFPAFAIASGLVPTNRSLSFSPFANHLGRETKNGQAVEHLTLAQSSTDLRLSGGSSFEHLSQLDFFLEPSTLLPIALTYNIHPDNNALLDIPVEIQFSDYHSVNGAQIPFHIQKFINNSLVLDLQVQSATFNSGLPTSTFAVPQP